MVARDPMKRIGSYELLFELASGGMATVHVARKLGDAGFERLVAVKRVHPHLLRERETFDMLCDEARLASLVRHPNVVPVIDVVEKGGELALVLEYVEGVPLSALLARSAEAGERLPLPIASRIFVDLARGLHAAHEAKDVGGEPLGIVHRDVSPQNVIVGTDGTSRLVDFGIARAEQRLVATKSGEVKGKLFYMAPEQLRGEALDRRADVYSAGAVLSEMATGRRLVPGDTDDEAMLALLARGDAVRAPSELPPRLAGAVEKAIAARAELRHATALELAKEVEAAIPPADPGDVAALVEQRFERALEERRARGREALLAAADEPEAVGRLPDPAALPDPGRARLGPIVVLGVLGLFGATAFTLRGALTPVAKPLQPLALPSVAPLTPSFARAPAAPPAGSGSAPELAASPGSAASAAPRPSSASPRAGRRDGELQPNPYGGPR